jgi:DNA-3-methyladenine glycosylase I
MPNEMQRCAWVKTGDKLYERYHDKEWGVIVKSDRKLFEFIILESAQAGLSWLTVLRKRQNYKKAFANFDPKKVASFTARDVQRLLNDAGIIRNRAKILAAINNAKIFLEIQKEFGSFYTYQWSFVGNQQISHHLKKLSDYPTVIPEAEAFAKDLKNRGFKFFGPTVAYAHMQAVGVVNDHMRTCYLAK